MPVIWFSTIHKPIWCSRCDLFPILPALHAVEKTEYGFFTCMSAKKIDQQQREEGREGWEGDGVPILNAALLPVKKVPPSVEIQDRSVLVFPRVCWIVLLHMHGKSWKRVCVRTGLRLVPWGTAGFCGLGHSTQPRGSAATARHREHPTSRLCPLLGIVCCDFGVQTSFHHSPQSSESRKVYAFGLGPSSIPVVANVSLQIRIVISSMSLQMRIIISSIFCGV